MAKNLNKHKIFKLQLIEVIDEFIISLERANRARQATTKEGPLEFSFENFMKWILYERNKKMVDKIKDKIEANK